jgi:broad specificity phosphatase PhoE
MFGLFRVHGEVAERRNEAMNVLLVGLGGAIGSVGRYLMGAWFQGLVGNPGFP